MNKRIPHIEDVHAESINGQKLYYRLAGDINTATPVKTDAPVMLSELEFLLERSNDPKLVAGLEAYAASRFRFFLRRSLREQAESGRAKAQGGFDIFGEPGCNLSNADAYKRLLDCVMSPEQKLVLEQIRFNHFPFEEAVINPITIEDEKPLTNGAPIATA